MSKIIMLAQAQVNRKSSFQLKHSYLSAAMLSLFLGISQMSWAETNTSKATSLNAIIGQVEDFQNRQNVWQTQEQIANLNVKNAGLWDNPSLSIEQTGFDSKKDQELAMTISQRLDIFGERKAQKSVAKISQQQVSLKQQIYATKLKLVVKHAWSQVAILTLEKALLQEQLQLSQESLNAAQNRYLAGSIAQVDVDRVRMLHLENQRLATQSQLQLNLAQQQLSHLWGESNRPINIELSAQNLWPKNVQNQITENLTQNVFQQSLQMDVQINQANLAYLKAKARPNPTLSLGLNRTKSPEAKTDNQTMLGIEIPLNIFNRNQYSIQIAQAQQNALSSQKQLYAQQNQLSIQSLVDEISGLEQQFQQLEQSQIPLAAQVQQRMLAGFRAGKFNISDVQQATQQIQDIRMRKIQLLKDGWQRAIDVESLSIGIDSSEITAKDAIFTINQSTWAELQALPVIGGGN